VKANDRLSTLQFPMIRELGVENFMDFSFTKLKLKSINLNRNVPNQFIQNFLTHVGYTRMLLELKKIKILNENSNHSSHTEIE